MIELRYKLWVPLIPIAFFILLFIIVDLSILWYIINERLLDWEEVKWLLLSMPFYPFYFGLISMVKNFSVTFNEWGIVRREIIKLGRFKIKNKEYRVKWEDINEINYFRFPIFQPYWGFEITSDSKMPSPGVLAILNWMFVNADEAIKYTINRVDPSKCEITRKARKALRKKYGIDVDKLSKKDENHSLLH